jgi:dihydroxyacetone kinase-like protein
MAPAVDAFDAALAADSSVANAARAAAEAAAAGRDATLPLVARKGRASYLGERSAGHLDPGAASTAILFDTLADALAGSAG